MNLLFHTILLVSTHWLTIKKGLKKPNCMNCVSYFFFFIFKKEIDGTKGYLEDVFSSEPDKWMEGVR